MCTRMFMYECGGEWEWERVRVKARVSFAIQYLSEGVWVKRRCEAVRVRVPFVTHMGRIIWHSISRATGTCP